MIRVLVADDHAVVRQGVRQILADVDDITVQDEAPDGSAALEKILRADFDVVLLDISMPERSGLEVLADIKNQRPRVAVLILSMHPEEQYALPALRAGASGYLPKTSAPQKLIGAIRKVAQGGKYVTPLLAEKLAEALENDTQKRPHERLSRREHQIMLRLAGGESISAVGSKLGLSVKTVSTYRRRILNKMGLAKNADLMLYAMQNRLID